MDPDDFAEEPELTAEQEKEMAREYVRESKRESLGSDFDSDEDYGSQLSQDVFGCELEFDDEDWP